MSKMPKQKPTKSRQDYGTPPEFLRAVKAKLGIEQFDIDLAASADNTVVPDRFYSEADNALTEPWKVKSGETGWNWCNPPFSKIGPWVKKAYYESFAGAKTAMLVPAAVGSNWWADWVDRKAYVLFLNGRLTFVGETTPYPKDCALLLYAPLFIGAGGSQVWNWKWEPEYE